MNRRVFAIGVLCALLTACELTTGPDWSSDGQGVSARAGSDAIVLRNRSGFTVHYFAVEEQTGTVLDLFFDPRAWPALEAGADARIPYA